MGEIPAAWVGPPDWAREPLQRFAYVDETDGGFTELRVHGVSGPAPASVLDYPADAVTLVRGNATSGFWRRWRLGGSLEDRPGSHRIEAFSWGGLTSGAALQALWLPLLPFSLVNLAHWMLPPFTSGRGRKAVSYVAVSLLRALGLSFTVTLALAGAEVTMDLGAWQCGANPGCLATLQRHDPLGGLLDDAGPRLAVGGGLLFLVLLVVLLAGSTRFQPLRDSDPVKSPVVPAAPGPPVLGDPRFWDTDHSTRWLRCLHAVAWCAATGAVATGALATARPAGDRNPVGLLLTFANLVVLTAAGLLSCWQRFGRGGKAWPQTRGYRWINLAAVALLVASLTVTAVYLPPAPDGAHPVLPWVQGALGWLTFGQAIGLLALAGCTGWLAWRRWGAGRAAPAETVPAETVPAENAVPAENTAPAQSPGGPGQWGPMLGGMLGPVVVLLGWLLGLSQSAGYGRWVADRLRGQPAAGGVFEPVLPNFYTWIDAYAVLAIGVVLGWAACLAWRVWRQTGPVAQQVRAAQTADLGAGKRSTEAEEQSRAQSAARWRILAQSVETVPVLLAAGAVAGFAFLLPGWFVHFAAPGWITVIASPGAWVITAGAAGLIAAAYLAFRNQNTRRVVGILWDITTFWPRANHPLTPPCSAQRAVPQLADRVAALTAEPAGFLVLSAHSQGGVLAAAAVLQLAHDEDGDRRECLNRVSLLTYGCPLRRLYARGFPAYWSAPVLEEVREDTGGRWLNLWAQTDPIGAAIALPAAPPGAVDWQMLPDPLTLDIDPRTGEPVQVCDHSGYLARPEYPLALESLRRLPAGEEHVLCCRDGETLDGRRGYVLRMAPGQLPGRGGSWSVTLYDQQRGLSPNALMRFSLGSTSELVTAEDDSVSVWVQRGPPPAARRGNWLPAPDGGFSLVLRTGWPSAGRPPGWTPPLLETVPH